MELSRLAVVLGKYVVSAQFTRTVSPVSPVSILQLGSVVFSNVSWRQVSITSRSQENVGFYLKNWEKKTVRVVMHEVKCSQY